MPAPDPRPWSNRMESIRVVYGLLTACRARPAPEAKCTGGEKMISFFQVRGPRFLKLDSIARRAVFGYRLLDSAGFRGFLKFSQIWRSRRQLKQGQGPCFSQIIHSIFLQSALI